VQVDGIVEPPNARTCTLLPTAPRANQAAGVERTDWQGGAVPATFEVVYMSGASPSSDLQKPKARGSATVSLAELGQALGERASTETPPSWRG
jgi:hypothetical protein